MDVTVNNETYQHEFPTVLLWVLVKACVGSERGMAWLQGHGCGGMMGGRLGNEAILDVQL